MSEVRIPIVNFGDPGDSERIFQAGQQWARERSMTVGAVGVASIGAFLAGIMFEQNDNAGMVAKQVDLTRDYIENLCNAERARGTR